MPVRVEGSAGVAKLNTDRHEDIWPVLMQTFKQYVVPGISPPTVTDGSLPLLAAAMTGWRGVKMEVAGKVEQMP